LPFSWRPLSARPAFCQQLGDPYTSIDMGLGFGARNVSMGGAFIAVGDGLAAVASNPAGLARLTRWQFVLGGGFAGQAASIPAQTDYWYDWPPELPPGSAYEWSDLHVSLRHAGLAASIRAGRQVFVLGLSYHRQLDFGASYAYSILRKGSFNYSQGDGTFVAGTLEQAENYQAGNTGALDVITGSLAFRIVKNVSFGLNLNFWKGQPRLRQAEDYSFVFTGDDLSVVNGQGTDISDWAYSYSTAVNLDFGLQWVSRLFTAGVVYRTGFSLDYAVNRSHDVSETRSDGTSYEDHYEYSGTDSYQWPARWGLGLAFRPTGRWTLSADYWIGDQAAYISYPDVENELRAGTEYLLPVKGLVVPLRAGWFTQHFHEDFRLQGFTFGTGLAWKDLVFDIGVVLHSKARDLTPFLAGSLKTSYWDVVTSITYRLGK
jgi:hypothetical protein